MHCSNYFGALHAGRHYTKRGSHFHVRNNEIYTDEYSGKKGVEKTQEFVDEDNEDKLMNYDGHLINVKSTQKDSEDKSKQSTVYGGKDASDVYGDYSSVDTTDYGSYGF